MNVGIRELRDALSRYLRRVRAGETVVVTERGRPIARIISAEVPDAIARLIGEGRVTWSGRPFSPPRTPLRPRPGPPVSSYVSEDRF